MYATVKYLLSPEGQKASILAGGDGKFVQVIEVANNDVLFASVVSHATVSLDGSVTLDLTCNDFQCEPYKPTYFDRQATVTELLADLETRRKRHIQDKLAKEEVTRQATMAVLVERRTRIGYDNVSGYEYTYNTPDWPYPVDAGVLKLPEAVTWETELVRERNNVRAETESRAARDREEAEVKAVKEREVEDARRAALNLRDGDEDYGIEDGALAKVPCYENHKRGRNWFAVIASNPKSPGGLDRNFAEKAKGELYYIVPTLRTGDAVEFGADYYSNGGRVSRSRWYGYVVRQDAERLVLHQCPDGKSAIREGRKYTENLISTA